MESQGIADVKIPVVPVVPAGELFVFVRHVQLFERAVEIAVVRKELVFGATVDADSRKRLCIARSFGMFEQIMVRAGELSSKNLIELPKRRLFWPARPMHQRAGMA